MHKPLFQPARSIVYMSLAQERAWACEHPIGDPWGGPAFGEKNKGGVFSGTYWEKGGIVNSVTSLVSNPIGYTNDRLKELDKTVIQPIGHGLEKVGQGIANDPVTFIATVAAIATQQYWAVPLITMASTAAKGGSFEDVIKAGAISAATTFIGVQGSDLIMGAMQVQQGAATAYQIAGQQISQTTAQVIAQTASYGTASAVAAAAQGKNVGEAALMGAVTGAVSGGVQGFAQMDFMKDFASTIDAVASKGVGSAVINGIAGAAGSALAGAITGRDMSTQAGMALVGGAVNGLAAAVEISGNFFSSNAAEAMDLQYDDYGPTKNPTVAQYLNEKLGPIGAGFVTNTVTSILTSTFTKGDPSTFLAQQVMGNLTQSIKNYFDPAFKAKYVDPLSGIMTEAKDAATTYNNLANRQNTLGEEINANVTSYNDRVAAVNQIINQRAALADQYNGYTSANSSQAQVNDTYAQIQALDAQIKAEVTAINSFYQSGIIDKQAQYDALNTETLAAQKNYADLATVLGKDSVPLTKYLNDVAKDMSITTAKTLDPSFNAEEYRTLNGLSPTDDVGAHYISTGKDQGLYTNFTAAQGRIEELQYKAIDTFARGMGYSGAAELPPSIYNDAMDKMQSHMGNNLKAWESFTPDSFLQQIKLPPTAIMPMWEKEAGKITTAQVIYDNGQEQLVNVTTKLPEGQMVATATQILKGEANVVRGDDGKFYWSVPDGKSTVPIYDVSTGRMVEALIGPAFEAAPAGATNVSYDAQGRVIGYTDAQGVMNVVVSGVNNPESAAEYKGTQLDETDPFVQMNTYAAMPDGIAANFNIKGLVQASKDVVEYMQKDATDLQKLQIATVVKSAGSVMQDVGTVLGDLSVTIGLSKTNNSTLSDLGKQLEGLADAKTPEQYKAAMADIKAMRDAAKGSDIVGVNAAIAQKYPDLVGVSVFGGELFEELIQSGVGKAAFVAGGALAATLGAPALISGAIATAAGIGTSMALDFAESYRGAKEDMYTRMLDVYKGQGYSDAQAAQMADAAATKAGVMNGIITSVINGATPGDLNKVLFGGKASPAQEAISNYFVDKVMGAAKVAAVEFGEGAVEGALQGAYNEALVYSVDPKKADYWKGISDSAMLESIIGAPVAAGTYGISNSFEMAQKTFTLANDQFTQAITNPNITTIGELGAQFKQWGIPTDVSMQIVPDILEANPNLTKFYATPAEYAAAIENGFGFDKTQSADIVNTKFNSQVTTVDEAKTALLNSGLINVTTQDAVNSGVVGTTPTDQAAKIANYANQQMVSAGEVQTAAQQENYAVTQDELNKLVGRGVQADVIAKFISEVDPKAATQAEASQYFQNLGYTGATADEIAQFVKSAPETEVQQAVQTYVGPHQVTREEAVQFYKDLNYTPTEAEIQQFVKHGKDIQEAQVKSDLGGYVDPRMVDSQEVRDLLTNMGLIVPATDADVARLTGQYAESELAGKTKEALPVIAANATYAQQQATKDQLLAQQQATRDNILAQMQAYEQAGLDRDTALNLAISGVAQDLGTTKADLLAQIGTTETNLKTEIAQQGAQLTGQIQNVQQALGRQTQQATAADLAAIQSMVAGTTPVNLAYDTNNDGKVDATDVTNVQQQIAFQQQQNLEQQIDPNTGLPVWIDKTTNQPITQPSLGGSQWEATGIYKVLQDQAAQQAATAKAQAATAKQTAQKQNFSQMMQMVLGAPDAAGQKVEVKEAPLAQIRNIYDFSSIFATPQQASMFPSPYGPVNTYGQNPQQGGLGSFGGMAANQPMYKQASGFAEGGMINNDISVGDGGSVDDLLNILKGNSG